MGKRRNQKGRLPMLAIVVCGSLVVIGLFVALIMRLTKPVPPSFTGQLETIRIGNIGEYSIFNLIAERQGFFTARGLNATVTEYPSGPVGFTELIAGHEDVQIAADFAGVRAAFDHPELRLLTATSKHSVFMVVARRDHGLMKAEDLRGKTVGVTKRTASEFFLARFLAFHGLGSADISIVDLQPEALHAQLAAGQLDAVVVFEPHAYDLVQQLGDRASLWSAQGDQASFAVAWTTGGFADRHPEALNRYLQALSDAERFVATHPAEAQNIVARALGYDLAYVEYVWPKFDFRLGLDQELLLTMEDQARWLIDTGLVKDTKVPNYLEVMIFEPLAATRPETIKIVH